MIARYTRPQIGALWTDAARMEFWRVVEVAAAEDRAAGDAGLTQKRHARIPRDSLSGLADGAVDIDAVEIHVSRHAKLSSLGSFQASEAYFAGAARMDH